MKDPAVLFFISDWLTSTSEMDSDCRGWYLNLILHNYDKKDLPNDIEKLAVLANVKFSEYERFKQVFEQVLKQKFEQIDNNRLSNLRTQTILKNREIFSDKRSDAGKMSYIMRYFAKYHSVEYKKKSLREYVKTNIDLTIDIKNEQVLEQVFKHLFELYRNVIEIENDIINDNLNSNEEIIKDWKSDFETYKSELLKVYQDLILDKDFIIQQEKYNPNIDISLSLEKAVYNYWITETGWKKKKQSRIKTIDWKATLINAIGMNKVYKQKYQLPENNQTQNKYEYPKL
jgi:hypothetical protein